jgi:hypothetical protein
MSERDTRRVCEEWPYCPAWARECPAREEYWKGSTMCPRYDADFGCWSEAAEDLDWNGRCARNAACRVQEWFRRNRCPAREWREGDGQQEVVR